MAIKLKTKVALGGIFLFALLILVGALSFYYFNRITEETKGIVKDNYETLNYSRDMLKEMDSLSSSDSMNAVTHFEMNLQAQEKNITEPGEKELTDSLRKNFEALKQNRSAAPGHLYEKYMTSATKPILITKKRGCWVSAEKPAIIQ
jgi:hypothetical protein